MFEFSINICSLTVTHFYIYWSVSAVCYTYEYISHYTHTVWIREVMMNANKLFYFASHFAFCSTVICISSTNSLVSHHFQPLFLKVLEYPLILYMDSADVCFPSVCVKNAHFQFSLSLLINVHFSLLNTEIFYTQEVTSG